MTRKQAFTLLALIAMSLLIFSFSLQNADTSNQQSGFFVTFIMNQFHLSDNYLNLLTTLVRKGAHFSEYAFLGILASCTYLAFNKYPYIWLSYGVINAMIDETIQFFVPGRSMQISDMLLDSIGFLCGFMLLYIIHLFLKKRPIH